LTCGAPVKGPAAADAVEGEDADEGCKLSTLLVLLLSGCLVYRSAPCKRRCSDH
jgi:hypothetical protein